jgi:hypothetical protein
MNGQLPINAALTEGVGAMLRTGAEPLCGRPGDRIAQSHNAAPGLLSPVTSPVLNRPGRTVQIGLFMRFLGLLRSLCGPKSRVVLASQPASGVYGGATPHPHRGTGACATVSAPG